MFSYLKLGAYLSGSRGLQMRLSDSKPEISKTFEQINDASDELGLNKQDCSGKQQVRFS